MVVSQAETDSVSILDVKPIIFIFLFFFFYIYFIFFFYISGRLDYCNSLSLVLQTLTSSNFNVFSMI